MMEEFSKKRIKKIGMHSVALLEQNQQNRSYISLEIKFGINFNDMLAPPNIKIPTLLTTQDNNEPDPFLSLLNKKIMFLEKELTNIAGLGSRSSLTSMQEAKVRYRGRFSEEKKKCEEMAAFYRQTLEDNKEYFEARSNKDLQSLVTAMVMFAANNKDINIANRFQSTFIFNKYLFPGDLYKIWKRINQPTGETINSAIAGATDYLRKKMANPLYQKEVEIFLRENGNRKFYNDTGHYYKAFQYSWQNVADENEYIGIYGDHFIYPNYEKIDEEQYQYLQRYNGRHGTLPYCILPSSPAVVNQYLMKSCQNNQYHGCLIGDGLAESSQLNQRLEFESPKAEVVQLLEGTSLKKDHKNQGEKEEFINDSGESNCRVQLVSSELHEQQQVPMKKKKQKKKGKKNAQKQPDSEANEQLVSLEADQTSTVISSMNNKLSNSKFREESDELVTEQIKTELKEEQNQEISKLQPEISKDQSSPNEPSNSVVSLDNLELDLKSEVSESTYQLASERTNEVKSEHEDLPNKEASLIHLKKEETMSISQQNLRKVNALQNNSSQKKKYFENSGKKLQNSRERKNQGIERSNQFKNQTNKKRYCSKYEMKQEIKERSDSSSSSSADIRLFRQEEIRQLEEEGFILVSKPKAKPQAATRGGNRSNRYRQLYQA